MTHLTTTKRNGSLIPTLLTDLFDTDQFFDSNLLNLQSTFLRPSKFMGTTPSVNITEREKDFLIELAAPGLTKKDFKVELEQDMLSISAEKEEKKEVKENGVSRKEFSYNSFSRTFRLPGNSKAEKIEAEYENGILKIEIPKKEATVSKPKKAITVS